MPYRQGRLDDPAGGRFWAALWAEMLGLPARPPGACLSIAYEPDGLTAQVAADRTLATASFRVSAMTASERAEWRKALGQPPADPAMPRQDDPLVRALASEFGPSPVPGLDDVVAACECGRTRDDVWCGHVQTLAMQAASHLAGDPNILWRWRGLNGPPPPEPVVPSPTRRLPRDRIVPRSAMRRRPIPRRPSVPSVLIAPWTLGDYLAGPAGEAGTEEATPLAPWTEAPRALVRLGPLPHTHRDAEAAAAIGALWARTRDMCEAIVRRSAGRAKERRPRRP